MVDALRAFLAGEQLLKAVARLDLPELEQFVAQVITLQAQRKAPSISNSETDLLLKINQGIPDALRQRYADLIQKRKQEMLAITEQAELLQLTGQVEKLETQRIEYLAELADLRKTTLVGLIKELGIQTMGQPK